MYIQRSRIIRIILLYVVRVELCRENKEIIILVVLLVPLRFTEEFFFFFLVRSCCVRF